MFVQKLSFGKIGFSKAMSNKWIRVDKAFEGGPRIFRTVCVKFFLNMLPRSFVVGSFESGVLSAGGEHRGPSQREAAPGSEG